MDRKSWPWMKKSSNKAASKPVSDSGISLSDHVGSQNEQAKKDEYKKPKYVQISVETYSYLTGLEDQVKSCEEQVTTLEDEIKDLNEKLSESKDEITNKDNLVKQHSKVAEEAVLGWEKAEAEADALKTRLDSVTHLKLTAEDRASHLDGALKECMRQIRKLKQEHEQELHDVVFTKTKQFDKVKLELESRLAALDQEKLRFAAENDALSRSLQDCSNMLIKLNEEKMQAEAEIELLKSAIESNQKEINSLKYEVHVVTKEMEIRNEEKNMSIRSAEVANKQHLEGVKKIAKLEAECQRLRSLVRKKLPGPAAMAQMKLEVENLGRDQVDYGFRRSPVKPPTHHVAPLHAHSLENDLLTERLLAMEEETKMLKEALATRNSELQTSRRYCTNTSSKLLILEAQMQSNGEQRSPKLNGQLLIEDSLSRSSSHIPNITTLSVDASDDDASCAGSWATPSVSEISYFKNEKKTNNPDMSENADHKELMDDFLEMEEKLTHQSNGSNEALSGSGIGVISGPDARNDKDPVVKLRFRLTAIINSLSTDTDINKALEDLRCVVQDTYSILHHGSESCIVDLCPMSDCKNNAKLASEKDIVLPFISQELSTAISQVQDFIIVLSKEAMAFRARSYDTEGLSQLTEKFSTTYEEVRNNKTSLVQYVFDLSHLISKANALQYKVMGYKNHEVENSDCIDKVALPENKAALWKCSFVEFEQLKSEKDSLVISLSACSENLKSTKIQLQEAEQHLAEVKSQLTTTQKSNVLSETQLKCMTESYKTLETRSEKLQAEVIHLQTKVDGLESDLKEERRSQLEALSKCKDLEDQLSSRIESGSSADSDAKTNEEKELAAASEKLAKCQETIFLLGKQLNAMSPRIESSRELYTKHSSISNMNCKDDTDQPESETDVSTHLHKANNDDLYLSTLNSSRQHARHRTTNSISSSCSSLTTPDQKHPRGLSRFFSTKPKNAC